MSSIAVRHIQRPEAGVVAALSRFGVATLHEAQGRSGLMDTDIRPIYTGASLCGPALTVLTHPGDNWMLHVAAELLQPGDVLVIACSAPNGDGMFGELLATSYRARGAKGLVSDTGVRDVKEISAMGFPVFSRHISAKGTVKATVGAVNVPVVCAGMLVNPGDVVAADDDGVVVIPRGKAAEVAKAAQAREDKEAATRKRLAAGELGLDVYGMREALAKAGLKYVE
ncbi:MAG: 4-carboxy-4-hydroxy-2-oxoadipate aldolase/oxaloacetate decarboxylase [Betaproteobacteria bacterium RIFCSPLOWO2_12_FULL_67_28]|nr:MAG: 4-carboxy-4-hydroxy-2-oxoadipate aldolase/oxaloacetate decarboxylase [Betaproteobacteria bacterium RIFCSPLOWO2_02_FULL_68_150]OGA56515.1 MAG: 4-carboxy-4-hydroxy-2-oxoadipate aldolase/oxaloacetate decarboxylase [Betaproteobacteria bacterium RIFCSPLOWO2_12_FULL_67_28]